MKFKISLIFLFCKRQILIRRLVERYITSKETGEASKKVNKERKVLRGFLDPYVSSLRELKKKKRSKQVFLSNNPEHQFVYLLTILFFHLYVSLPMTKINGAINACASCVIKSESWSTNLPNYRKR